MSSNSVSLPNATSPTHNQYVELGLVQRTNIPWYLPSLPQPLQPHIQHLFEDYVGLAPSAVIPHIESVRAKAWQIKPYPCIGMYTFIHSPMYHHPVYAEILSRVKSGGVFLDVGAGFGQELRRLAADGAPGQNMYAVDLSSDFWELGYDLFQDRGLLDAKLIVVDVLASDDSSSKHGELEALKGNVDIIHAGSFFHLFDWDTQVEAAKKLVALTRGKGALLVGHQTGRKPAKRTLIGGEPKFYHDEESWRKMWTEVGEATGTTWGLEVDVGEHEILGLEQGGFDWMGPYAKALRFVATRD